MKPTPPDFEDVAFGILGDADLASLQDLHERCADFITLVYGAAPGADAARELLEDAPSGHPADRKRVLGLRQGGALVGVVELLIDYPEPCAWYLGLLMLAPEARGRGLGGRVVDAVLAWIAEEGGRVVRLAVQTQNASALRFWTRKGFQALDEVDQVLEFRTNRVTRMLRAL